ncbi:MAG: indole-3-glycerol phosphate synthase TrpC [Alphaproteobacteria bacterium]|nr:indole-3-glycerol phosphate synthase TrpC [Alphaproteobacteria bacterium]
MNKLDEICARKKEHVAAQKAFAPLEELEDKIEQQEHPRGFLKALKNKSAQDEIALIAEVKKASPSKGVIREDFDAVEIAKTYEQNGATCLSVLTDIPYFQGHNDYLRKIKKNVSLPILRKDFMIDPYQIYEARAIGADCILLIMACLSDIQASELYNLSVALDMDVLVEVHDENELNRALDLNPMMIGVNNRNLKTLGIDHQIGLDLAKKNPKNIFMVAESGLYNYQDVQKFKEAGYEAFLIGESLMREDDIAKATREILGNE